MSGINFWNLPPFVEKDSEEEDFDETDETWDSSSLDENGESSTQEDEDLNDELEDSDWEDYEEEILDNKKTQKKEKDNSKDKSKSTKDLPFNEHPRFKHLIKENKFFKSRLEKQDSLIANLEQVLKQNWLIEEEDWKVDLTKMSKEELSNFIKQITSKEEHSEEFDIELEDKLLELEESWKKFDRKELLSIAIEETNGDLDMAYKIYRREQNLLEKAKQSFKRDIAKKKVSESIWKKTNWVYKETSPKNILKSFDDLRRDAYEKFN